VKKDLGKDLFIQTSVKVHGRVQGVGFRMFVFVEAKKLGLLGWVKNCPDGSVETLYQGPKDLVDQMIEKTKRGPSLAQVQSIEISQDPDSSRFPDFSIRP
jgi:acylphosphatase